MRNLMFACFALSVAFTGFAATGPAPVQVEQQLEDTKETKKQEVTEATTLDAKKNDKGCGCGGKPKK
ncbi:MAG: hypothetical protein FJZ64_03335 [Chlamydiae bacterium]|nr:hypothetical protein [Chlamydiota bacterium]